MTISFDLDSTLCDTRHRRRLIREWNEKGLEPDWDEYSMLCDEDAPTQLVHIVHLLQSAGVEWHATSARSECAREKTLEWFTKYNLRPETLTLCSDNDEHSKMGHTAWKIRALKKAHEEYGVTTHYDDSPALVLALAEELPEVQGILATPPGASFSWDQA